MLRCSGELGSQSPDGAAHGSIEATWRSSSTSGWLWCRRLPGEQAWTSAERSCTSSSATAWVPVPLWKYASKHDHLLCVVDEVVQNEDFETWMTLEKMDLVINGGRLRCFGYVVVVYMEHDRIRRQALYWQSHHHIKQWWGRHHDLSFFCLVTIPACERRAIERCSNS